MNLNRKELLKALKQAMPGVESGNVILEGADTFIFNDGFIHTYNDNISVSVPFYIKRLNKETEQNENVSGALKAKDFYDLINRYAENNLRLIPKEGVWIIKSVNGLAELTLLESGLVERVKGIFPKDMKYSDLPERFMEGISICQFSSNKSVLSGIHISETIIMSTDEIRINWYEMDKPVTDTFWITDSAASELCKLSNIKKYCVSDSWVHFKTEDETVFSCKRLAQDKYPLDKIKKLVENHGKGKEDISNELPTKLMDAVNRAAALSQNIESFDTIKLTFNNEGIEVFSQRPSGKYTENVPWEKPFKKEIDPVSVFVDYNMIENGLKYSKTFYLKKTMAKEKELVRIVFKSEHGIQLISTFNGNEE